MPIGASKVGALGGLVPGGSVTFNASDTWDVPPGVKIVSITGAGATGNPGVAGNPGNPGNPGTGGAGGSGGRSNYISPGGPAPGAQGKSGGHAFRTSPFFFPCGTNIYNSPLVPQKISRGGACGVPGIPIQGTSGIGGNAGTAGCAGSPGTTGCSSSALGNTFPGGAGGNAGVAGAAGTAGTGGAGGNGGTTNSTGTGGTGGGNGGATLNINAGYTFMYGGGGGGGAGAVNSGNPGYAAFVQPVPGAQPFPAIYAIAGKGGNDNTSGPLLPLFSPSPTNLMGGPGGLIASGYNGASPAILISNDDGGWDLQSFRSGQGIYSRTGTPQISGNPQANIYRSGGGGGAGGSSPQFPGFAGNYSLAGGGGGGGRGNAGGAGGSSPTPSGAAATPVTYNCVSVTPGAPTPITVASPGGQIVISWNPQ